MIASVPPGASQPLIEACLAASESIRLERNAVLPRQVELRARSLALRFDPIQGNPPMLRVPFSLSFAGGSEIAGHLQLWTSDPLTLAFKQPPAPRDLVRAWAAVLLGFADLTVWPEQEFIRSSGGSSTRSKRPRARASSRSNSPQSIPRRRRRYIGTRARIDLGTLRGYMVVGHRRWLPDGQSASAENTREAASLGIVLEAGQTWVRPHVRAGTSGGPRQITAHWDPPSALAELI
jgi:hypothetical protein